MIGPTRCEGRLAGRSGGRMARPEHRFYGKPGALTGLKASAFCSRRGLIARQVPLLKPSAERQRQPRDGRPGGQQRKSARSARVRWNRDDGQTSGTMFAG
jgi:hypothetical protein